MSEKAKASGPRLRISHKLTLAFFLFAVGITGLLSAVLYRTASDQVMRDIRQRLHDIAAIAPLAVDAETHAELTEPEQQGSLTYMRIKRALQQIRDNASDIHFIYTMRLTDDGRIAFVVDAEENAEDMAHLGSIYEEPSELLQKNFATMTDPMVEEDIYTDNWGTWLSGYAPIFLPDGTLDAVVGVDISAKTVAEHLNRVLLRSLLIFCLALPVTLFFGWQLGRKISRPIIAMKDGAEKIGRGELDTRVDVRSRDELGVLGHSLNSMAESLGNNRRELMALMEKYRSIFDNAAEGIFQSSPDGRLLTANKAMADILGYDSPDEMITSLTDLGTQLYAQADDRKRFLDEVATGRVRALKVLMKTKGGDTVWTELSARRLETGDGLVIEGIIQDISERLEKEQAEKERQAAEAASQAKSDFLANMSHEIRTPMNAVMGLTDLMLRTEMTGKQTEYLRKIKSSSQTLLAVINDILDFSKIEAGRLDLEETGFSLYEVMANLSEMFSHKAHEQDVELAVSLAPGIPCALKGDPVRLGQVLINLTGNALKFTKSGEVVVSVAPAPDQPDDPDKVALEFSVRDTGIGIPPDRLESIFDSFTQADSSTTRQFGGTGLGLAICKQITAMMGEPIRAESVEGEGSRFFFTSVFKRQPEDKELRPRTPRDLRGLRVLIVDDNATARDIMAASVDSFQMQSTTAASGEEALKLVAETDPPFDLILMDWKMPGMGGVEAARKIKLDLKADETPIVCMVSAYGREDLLQQSERSLLDAFLHKPVNQSFLFDTIMELFGREDHAISPNREADREEVKPAPHLAGARVLLVEDNEINREVASEWLLSANMIIEVATNGREAVDTLKAMEELPDLVLMDIQMPVMDGLTATKMLREDKRFKELPIIAMTAHALKGDRERCLEAGMDDYLTKPIDPRQLFTTLAHWTPDIERAAPVRESGNGEDAPLPDSLPGISIREGLFRCNNKPPLYRKVLKTFLKDFGDTAERIPQLVADGKGEDARREAHSIKGVGGNIGADTLSRTAADLEDYLSADGATLPEKLWNPFVQALAEVLDGLRAADLDGGAQKSHAAILDKDQLAGKLDELRSLLDDDLGLARELALTLAPSLDHHLPDNPGSKLAETIDDFDIDAAQELASELAGVLDDQG